MLATDIITLGAALFGLLTAIAGSSACAYTSSRTGRTNIAVLKVKVQALENLIQDLKRQMDGIAVLKPDPSPWIRKAQEFLDQVDVSELEGRANDKCANGWLPNLRLQVPAGKLIEETIAQLDALIEEGQSTCKESSVKGYKQPAVSVTSESRKKAEEAIWKTVSQTQPGTICIHGVAGVGKTAVAISIHNRALTEPNLFDYVIWVPVKYGIGLWQVQEDLARSLDLDVSTISDTTERARRLSNSLFQKRRFLLVLDSMWQAFSLQDIGIPEPTEGCKLIVTSRIRSVCRRIARKQLVEIMPLDIDEAWEMFVNEVGSNCTSLQAEILAATERAIPKLDGLPYAIKIFSQVLSEIHEESSARFNAAWKEELATLGRMPTYLGHRDQELFDCFRYSYENLRPDTRPCFLFCALFPVDHPIEIKLLIEYWMWEGLLGKIETLEESMKRGKDVLKELKDAHLLEEGGEDSVKMLKLVRSAAIDTMVRAGHQVFIRSGQSLTDIPFGQDWPPEVERASFMRNEIKALVMRSKPNCKRLSLLLLQDNPLHINGHDNFFYGMRGLRVVDLSHTKISMLPKSLSYLTNLLALLLRNCPNLKSLPPMSNLQQLVVLDLFGTPLENFPEGVQNMTKIRRLDLSLTRIGTFPAKVLDKLVQLEELLLMTDENGGYVWGSNQIDWKWKGACVEELVGLGKLTTLQLNFLNSEVFSKYVQACAEAEKSTCTPVRFRFCVGGFHSHSTGHVGENSVTVVGNYRVSLPDRTSELRLMMSSESITVLALKGCLRDLNVLDVSNFSGLRYLLSVKILGSLKSLRKISVRRCEEMEEVILPAPEGNPITIFLPELTTMVFFDLPRLESICRGQILNCPHLCSVEVWSCENLKLPMILGRKRGKIEIRGESSWLDQLKWDNPHDSNALFQESPHLNSNLRLVEAHVPLELEATPRIWKKQYESSTSSVQDVARTWGAISSRSSAFRFLRKLNFPAFTAASLIQTDSSNGDNASATALTAVATDSGALKTVFDTTLRIVKTLRVPSNESDKQPPKATTPP